MWALTIEKITFIFLSNGTEIGKPSGLSQPTSPIEVPSMIPTLRWLLVFSYQPILKAQTPPPPPVKSTSFQSFLKTPPARIVDGS